MPEWRIGCGVPENISVSAGNTRHVPILGAEDLPFSSETNPQITIRRNYTLTGLYVRVDTNATTSASTVRPRINAADGNLFATIPAGTSGEFEDVGNSDSLVAGDLIANRIINGGGGTITITAINYNLGAVDNESIIGLSRGATITDGNTNEEGITGELRTLTTEADAQYLMRTSGLFKNFQVHFNTNSITTAITCRVRINGADGNQNLVFPAATSGTMEDLVNTDAFGDGDLVNYNTSSPLGAGIAQLEYITMTMASLGRIQGLGDMFSTDIGFGVTRFFPIECGFGETAVEGDVQVRAGVPFFAKNFIARVGNNSVNGSTTGSFRINGADSDLVVTIPASTSGDFEDLGEVEVDSRDLLSLSLVIGGTSGVIGLTYLAFQQDPLLSLPPLPPGEQQPDSAEWGIGRRVSVMAY